MKGASLFASFVLKAFLMAARRNFYWTQRSSGI
jgi:hypothetical protein